MARRYLTAARGRRARGCKAAARAPGSGAAVAALRRCLPARRPGAGAVGALGHEQVAEVAAGGRGGVNGRALAGACLPHRVWAWLYPRSDGVYVTTETGTATTAMISRVSTLDRSVTPLNPDGIYQPNAIAFTPDGRLFASVPTGIGEGRRLTEAVRKQELLWLEVAAVVAWVRSGNPARVGCPARAIRAGIYGVADMDVSLALDGLVANGLVGVVSYLWPQTMSWAREHILPWVERNIPDLANSVRLAFQDLDKVADDLQQVVRAAWCRLRTVLISQSVQFVQLAHGVWVVRFISCMRVRNGSGEEVACVVGEQQLDWASQCEEIRAAAVSNRLSGTWIDVVRARDRMLAAPV